MPTKPTVVFLPGSWHTGIMYEDAMTLLRAVGYPCVAVDLPSVGAPPLKTLKDDVDAVRKVLEHLTAEGKECILAMHSYGSMPGNEASKGLDKNSREAAGEKGCVIALVYLAAFVLPEGATVLGVLKGRTLPWLKVQDGIAYALTPEEIFYSDVPIELASKYKTLLKPQSFSVFLSPVGYAAWRDIPSSYLVCSGDMSVPAEEQELMLKEAPCVKIIRCACGHSPFVSNPGLVARVIREAAGEVID